MNAALGLEPRSSVPLVRCVSRLRGPDYRVPPPCCPQGKAVAAMAADVEGDVYVLVEHPFEYTGKDGRRVAIQPNERYRLLRRSTEHWWQVQREPGGRPFYLPAQYVRQLPAIGDPATAPPPPVPHPGPAAPEPLAYDYRFVSAPVPAGPDSAPAEPRGRAGSLCGPARRGGAMQRRSLAPGQPVCLYTRPSPRVRPAQSLDDLARTAAAPPAGLLGSAGSFKACSVAGSWVCPRALARSDSENVYEAVEDLRGLPREQRPEQVSCAEPGGGRGLRPLWAGARGEPLGLAIGSTRSSRVSAGSGRAPSHRTLFSSTTKGRRSQFLICNSEMPQLPGAQRSFVNSVDGKIAVEPTRGC